MATTRLHHGHDPLCTYIDQTVTVDFTGKGPDPWVRDLLTELSGTLAAYGDCAGILREQAPPPLDSAPGVDAVIASTENELM